MIQNDNKMLVHSSVHVGNQLQTGDPADPRLDPMLDQCWATAVYDGGPTLDQHWITVSRSPVRE